MRLHSRSKVGQRFAKSVLLCCAVSTLLSFAMTAEAKSPASQASEPILTYARRLIELSSAPSGPQSGSPLNLQDIRVRQFLDQATQWIIDASQEIVSNPPTMQRRLATYAALIMAIAELRAHLDDPLSPEEAQQYALTLFPSLRDFTDSNVLWQMQGMVQSIGLVLDTRSMNGEAPSVVAVVSPDYLLGVANGKGALGNDDQAFAMARTAIAHKVYEDLVHIASHPNPHSPTLVVPSFPDASITEVYRKQRQADLLRHSLLETYPLEPIFSTKAFAERLQPLFPNATVDELLQMAQDIERGTFRPIVEAQLASAPIDLYVAGDSEALSMLLQRILIESKVGVIGGAIREGVKSQEAAMRVRAAAEAHAAASAGGPPPAGNQVPQVFASGPTTEVAAQVQGPQVDQGKATPAPIPSSGKEPPHPPVELEAFPGDETDQTAARQHPPSPGKAVDDDDDVGELRPLLPEQEKVLLTALGEADLEFVKLVDGNVAQSWSRASKTHICGDSEWVRWGASLTESAQNIEKMSKDPALKLDSLALVLEAQVVATGATDLERTILDEALAKPSFAEARAQFEFRRTLANKKTEADTVAGGELLRSVIKAGQRHAEILDKIAKIFSFDRQIFDPKISDLLKTDKLQKAYETVRANTAISPLLAAKVTDRSLYETFKNDKDMSAAQIRTLLTAATNSAYKSSVWLLANTLAAKRAEDLLPLVRVSPFLQNSVGKVGAFQRLLRETHAAKEGNESDKLYLESIVSRGFEIMLALDLGGWAVTRFTPWKFPLAPIRTALSPYFPGVMAIGIGYALVKIPLDIVKSRQTAYASRLRIHGFSEGFDREGLVSHAIAEATPSPGAIWTGFWLRRLMGIETMLVLMVAYHPIAHVVKGLGAARKSRFLAGLLETLGVPKGRIVFANEHVDALETVALNKAKELLKAGEGKSHALKEIILPDGRKVWVEAGQGRSAKELDEKAFFFGNLKGGKAMDAAQTAYAAEVAKIRYAAYHLRKHINKLDKEFNRILRKVYHDLRVLGVNWEDVATSGRYIDRRSALNVAFLGQALEIRKQEFEAGLLSAQAYLECMGAHSRIIRYINPNFIFGEKFNPETLTAEEAATLSREELANGAYLKNGLAERMRQVILSRSPRTRSDAYTDMLEADAAPGVFVDRSDIILEVGVWNGLRFRPQGKQAASRFGADAAGENPLSMPEGTIVVDSGDPMAAIDAPEVGMGLNLPAEIEYAKWGRQIWEVQTLRMKGAAP